MKNHSRIRLGFKALVELGPEQVGLNALYRFGLRIGHYQRQLRTALTRLDTLNNGSNLTLHPCLSTLPERELLGSILGELADKLFEEADEIVSGKVRLFGGEPVPLVLDPPGPLEEWSNYEGGTNRIGDQDIKFIWEPGRFGWACTLARAFHLSGNEQYSETFWEYTERFLSANPPFMGPHWSSAQEAGIRLIALAFAYQVFSQSDRSTPERLELLARAIAIHAERIPATMVYSRSLNNNHLITEALGLYTASALLREYPLSAKWHRLGWKWLQYAYRTQISPDGTYTQHSTNYHRLMLQAGLWMFAVHDCAFPSEITPPIMHSHLECATRWLWQLLDTESGRVPNLGHNDGAYILPLTVSPYLDYRPVINAAACKFLHTELEPTGPWCEMSYWFCNPAQQPLHVVGANLQSAEGDAFQINQARNTHSLHNPFNKSWAFLRGESYTARPAHADQLHVDLWWRGLNLAQDPGTYLYNGAPPWDNSLTSAFVHNTLTVDGLEFMLRAGRFLYLDWAQAKVTSMSSDVTNQVGSLSAEHNGYRKWGLALSRKITTFRDGHWEINDQLSGPTDRAHTIRLHWLLPDWEYEIAASPDRQHVHGKEVRIRSPYGWVFLQMSYTSPEEKIQPPQAVVFQLARAGVLLFGQGTIAPTIGWASPIYGVKIPALACILEVSQAMPAQLNSTWILPGET